MADQADGPRESQAAPSSSGSSPSATVDEPPSVSVAGDDAAHDDLLRQQALEALADFARDYEAVKGRPLKVVEVNIKGLDRTKLDIVTRELASVREASSLDDVKDTLLEAWENLLSLEIFEAVEMVIDEGDPDKPGTCKVNVTCAEKNIFRLNAGTYVQGTEGSMEVSAGVTNSLGRAESLDVSAEWGTSHSNEFAVHFRLPRLRGKNWGLGAQLLQQYHTFQRHSSFCEQLRGGGLMLSSMDGRHLVSYDLAWRRISDPTRQASKAVQRQAGHSLKSALRYMFRFDTFDDLTYPTQGWGFRSISEVAGLGLDPSLLRFAKQQLSCTWAAPLGPHAVFSFGLEGGIMFPWSTAARRRPTCISERFFLGGPSSLRGFGTHSVGPTDVRRRASSSSPEEEQESERDVIRHDYLGGDLFASALAAIRFELPVPLLQQVGVRGQVFANAGNIALLPGREAAPPRPFAETFLDSFRLSVGAGIVWPTNLGNLEINFCRVLRSQPLDRAKHGFQMGFAPRAW